VLVFQLPIHLRQLRKTPGIAPRQHPGRDRHCQLRQPPQPTGGSWGYHTAASHARQSEDTPHRRLRRGRSGRALTSVFRRDFRVLRAATGEAACQMMEKEGVGPDDARHTGLPGISGPRRPRRSQGELPLLEVVIISAMQEVDDRRSTRCATALITTSPRASMHESVRSLLSDCERAAGSEPSVASG
jgi:hypothetical protein